MEITLQSIIVCHLMMLVMQSLINHQSKIIIVQSIMVRQFMPTIMRHIMMKRLICIMFTIPTAHFLTFFILSIMLT